MRTIGRKKCYSQVSEKLVPLFNVYFHVRWVFVSDGLSSVSFSLLALLIYDFGCVSKLSHWARERSNRPEKSLKKIKLKHKKLVTIQHPIIDRA